MEIICFHTEVSPRENESLMLNITYSFFFTAILELNQLICTWRNARSNVTMHIFPERDFYFIATLSDMGKREYAPLNICSN